MRKRLLYHVEKIITKYQNDTIHKKKQSTRNQINHRILTKNKVAANVTYYHVKMSKWTRHTDFLFLSFLHFSQLYHESSYGA